MSRSGSMLGVASRSATLAACAAVALALATPSSARSQALPAVDDARMMEWIEELSNWGRWGPDDELGTLNLITPEKRRAAAALVRDGVAVSLARDVSKEASPENANPLQHRATWREGHIGLGLDSYEISYHGYDFSHLDALPHFSVDGQLYNGFSTETVRETGAERLGIGVMTEGVFTRGVLMDLPRLFGVEYLEPGTAVTTEDLERWERETGIGVEPGDVLLVRTGRWVKRARDGGWPARGLIAGLHVSTARWLKARDLAAIGSDGVTDAIPTGVEGYGNPLHVLLLVAMGTPIFDNLDLDALATEAAARGRWTFLFSAAPMRIPGGLGSPLNPLAIF